MLIRMFIRMSIGTPANTSIQCVDLYTSTGPVTLIVPVLLTFQLMIINNNNCPRPLTFQLMIINNNNCPRPLTFQSMILNNNNCPRPLTFQLMIINNNNCPRPLTFQKLNGRERLLASAGLTDQRLEIPRLKA